MGPNLKIDYKVIFQCKTLAISHTSEFIRSKLRKILKKELDSQSRMLTCLKIFMEKKNKKKNKARITNQI